jgi:hypothetical protein
MRRMQDLFLPRGVDSNGHPSRSSDHKQLSAEFKNLENRLSQGDSQTNNMTSILRNSMFIIITHSCNASIQRPSIFPLFSLMKPFHVPIILTRKLKSNPSNPSKTQTTKPPQTVYTTSHSPPPQSQPHHRSPSPKDVVSQMHLQKPPSDQLEP